MKTARCLKGADGGHSIISSVIGGSSVALGIANRPYRTTANDRRKPLTRYSAVKSALRERLAPTELHHQVGHDLWLEKPPTNNDVRTIPA